MEDSLQVLKNNFQKDIVNLYNTDEYIFLKKYYSQKSFFEVLGIIRDENVHSNFLAWILDPHESHNLDEYPIKKLLQIFIIILRDCSYAREKDNLFPKKFIDWIITGDYEIKNVTVYREKAIKVKDKKGRLDLVIQMLLILNDEKDTNVPFNIILENKVLSKENKEQTKTYYEWAVRNLNKNCQNIFVYLTPISNRELINLKKQQCSCKDFIQINYQYLIDYLIEPCRKHNLPKDAEVLIDNYIKCLSLPVIDYEDLGEKNTSINGGLVMGMSEKEKELLINFYKSNKSLILSVLNAVLMEESDGDDDIEQEERETMKKVINTISTRDYTKYKFNGTKYGKGRLVLAVMQEYIKQNNPSYDELMRVFPKAIQGGEGGKGVFEKLDSISDKDLNSKPKRYFVKEDETLNTSDGFKIAVCNQWGAGNICDFIDAAKRIGFEIEVAN